MGNIIGIFKELLSFIRIETCIFAAGIGLTGYFSSLAGKAHGAGILFLLFSIFLGTGASYGYNHIKDRKEDLINKKRLNIFVKKKGVGMAIVASLYLSGFALSILVSPLSSVIYVVLAALSIIYSGARVKEKFLAKNILTGLVISFSFAFGAAASNPFSWNVASCLLTIFMLCFAANILGDIRGRRGDKAIGMTTLPILLGVKRTKIIIYSLLSLVMLSIILEGNTAFYPVMPFVAASMILLSKNLLRMSRMSMFSSFVLLSLMMAIGL